MKIFLQLETHHKNVIFGEMCYARFAYFMLYVLCINVTCMMSVAPIRVDLPTPQTNPKQNKRITGRCHESRTIISSFNMAGGYSFHKALLERSRRIGWGKTLFYSHLPLNMKPKDYRQLLKLEAPAWGEGRGKRKVERLGCSPMLVCQLWRILIVTIVFASTWVVTLDLLTFRLESWCISPKNIVSVLRQLAQYPFLFDITFGISSWPLCTEQNTHHFIMIIILGNISSAVTEQVLFVQLDFAIYEKQKSISTFDFFWCLTYPPWN